MLRKFPFVNVNYNIIVSDARRIFNQHKIKIRNCTILPVTRQVACDLDKNNLIIIVESLDEPFKPRNTYNLHFNFNFRIEKW